LEEVKGLAVANFEKRKENATLEGWLMKVKHAANELCDYWLDHRVEDDRNEVKGIERLGKGVAELEVELKELKGLAKERAGGLSGNQCSWWVIISPSVYST
jgi:hypothetical protein